MARDSVRHKIDGRAFEYQAEATDGVSLTTGEAWFGVNVRYRPEGARHWHRFNIVDCHSWDVPKITAAIEHMEAQRG